ncbi:caspase family protein [Methylobacterium sp. sgz302541]|uniref:caspase family protein n=1 Tax=unclassified Methylobacterium TaxID=2615210 RepID=UPI003D34605C
MTGWSPAGRGWPRLLGAALLLLALCAAGRAAERRTALVIGNSAYRNVPTLENPVRDARAMAAMLRETGFDSVTLKENLDSLDLKRAIRSFVMEARNAEIAVVYFAGHGLEVNGINYLIPTDGKLKTDFDAEDEGVSLERIITAVEPAKRLRLVIVDACRNNPFLNTMQRAIASRAVTAGLAKVEPAVSDTLVAFAARAGSVADDGSGDHSPFTAALLKHLPEPGLDIRVAFGRIRDDVLRSTGGRQEPFVYGSLGGSTISLVPAIVAPAPPQPSPAEADREIRRDYEFAERIGRKEAWVFFLKAHPTGFFAELAKAQLTKFEAPAAETPRNDAPDRTRVSTIRPPSAAPPAIIERPPVPVEAPPPPEPAPLSGCEREGRELARLRSNPIREEIQRLSGGLTCDGLRAQVARLLESVAPDDAPVAPPERPSAPVPVLPPRPAAAPPAVAEAGGDSRSCRAEALTLAELRASRDAGALGRFARSLRCESLRPQVQRLRESLSDD